MTNDAALCPACHHRDHDPGGCDECPRCELHYDEAIDWLQRRDALNEALAAERRATVERIRAEIGPAYFYAEFTYYGEGEGQKIRRALVPHEAIDAILAAEAGR